jgi:hypothetical protein
VSATSSEATLKTATNSDGRFSIEVSTPGRYFLTPARNGMVFSRPAHLQIPREPGVWVDVVSPPVQSLELRMVREAVITGQVLDARGKTFPAVQGKVDVHRFGYDAHGKRKLIAVPVVHEGSLGTYGRMDDKGTYRLYGLQPGDYYVSASGGGARLFYPGTPNESLAQPIHVSAGDEVRLAPITLPTPQQTRVRFRFVAADGKSIGESVASSAVFLPNKDGSVRFFTAGAAVIGLQMPAEPDVRTIDLSPGRYEQFFGLTGMRNTTELFYGKAAFDVGNEAMQVDIPVSPGIRVNGSLTLEDAAGSHPAPPGIFCKLHTDAEHAETVGASTRTGCLGAAFSPSLYELEIVGMPADAYVETAQAAGEDVRAKGLCN